MGPDFKAEMIKTHILRSRMLVEGKSIVKEVITERLKLAVSVKHAVKHTRPKNHQWLAFFAQKSPPEVQNSAPEL